MRRKPSVFDKEYRDIWIVVYGVLIVVVGLLITLGSGPAPYIGGLLIISPVGSYLIISLIEWMT